MVVKLFNNLSVLSKCSLSISIIFITNIFIPSIIAAEKDELLIRTNKPKTILVSGDCAIGMATKQTNNIMLGTTGLDMCVAMFVRTENLVALTHVNPPTLGTNESYEKLEKNIQDYVEFVSHQDSRQKPTITLFHNSSANGSKEQHRVEIIKIIKKLDKNFNDQSRGVDNSRIFINLNESNFISDKSACATILAESDVIELGDKLIQDWGDSIIGPKVVVDVEKMSEEEKEIYLSQELTLEEQEAWQKRDSFENSFQYLARVNLGPKYLEQKGIIKPFVVDFHIIKKPFTWDPNWKPNM
jgi:hypothetical protein